MNRTHHIFKTQADAGERPRLCNCESRPVMHGELSWAGRSNKREFMTKGILTEASYTRIRDHTEYGVKSFKWRLKYDGTVVSA
jgi:hypothetical protein